MSESITITVPEISATALADLETLNQHAFDSEVAALTAIREKYAPLAKHAGFVKTGYWWRGDGSNWHESQNYYFSRDGKKIHGLLAYDGFYQKNTSQFAGDTLGDRVYLLESAEWLRIEREGRWSNWQSDPEFWTCNPDGFSNENFKDFLPSRAGIELLSDREVAEQYKLDEIVVQLGESLKGLAERIPQRMTRLRQRAELASRLIDALKA